MEKLFIDTNIIIDVLAKREGFYLPAAQVLSLADAGKVKVYMSSLSVSHAHYILKKPLGKAAAKKVLRDLKVIVEVLDVTKKVVELALNDEEFLDFEDSLQYFTALENGVDIIITRNIKDFTASTIPVMNADQFLKR